MQHSNKEIITIILPCLNEAPSIGNCLESIGTVLKTESLHAEIIVVDNGSTDDSAAIVTQWQERLPQLRLVHEPVQGYGSAYLTGIRHAQGTYIFMADADETYDFADIPRFIAKLDEGYDMIVGNRFGGMMTKKAMPLHHRYIGNPFLSFLVKTFFGVRINDIHCGERAVRKDALEKISLYTTGMEFASEMIIKAAKAKLRISELSVSYSERSGESKLRSFRDGWRHLRFILLYSPLHLFLIPGIILFSTGLIASFVTPPSYVQILPALTILLGYQIIIFAGFAKVYAITHLGDSDKTIEKLFRYITIEKVGVLGLLAVASGALLFTHINAMTAFILIILGIQTFFASFMFSMLGIKEK